MATTARPSPSFTLLTHHPWLRPCLGSEQLDRLLFWTAGAVAALVAVLGKVDWRRELRGLVVALLMTTGAVYWTSAEYAFHRCLDHRARRRFGVPHRVGGDRSREGEP